MEYKLIRSKRKTIELSIGDDFIPLVKAPTKTSIEDIENFVEERDNRIFELRNMLRAERIPVNLYTGAELYLSDGVFNADNLPIFSSNAVIFALIVAASITAQLVVIKGK